MNPEYYLEHIDFQATTKLDFTTLFRDPKVFRALILDLIKPFRHDDFNKIACPESLGFVLGSAAATELRKGLILIRKSGKLPNIQSNIARQTFTDYTDAKNSFEVNKALIEPGDRVLVIDDWVETGGQMKGLTRLLTRRPKPETSRVIWTCKRLHALEHASTSNDRDSDRLTRRQPNAFPKFGFKSLGLGF